MKRLINFLFGTIPPENPKLMPTLRRASDRVKRKRQRELVHAADHR